MIASRGPLGPVNEGESTMGLATGTMRKTSFATGRRRERFSWSLLRSVLYSGACCALFGILAVRALAAPGSPGFQSGVLMVEFSDRAGAPRAAPYFNVTDAYPGMPPITATVTIRNEGSLPAAYELRVADLLPSERSLADVLHLRVTTSSGSAVYEGGVSGMFVRGAEPLRPGRLATFSIEAWWPSQGARDNRCQGRTLSFGLLLASDAATESR